MEQTISSNSANNPTVTHPGESAPGSERVRKLTLAVAIAMALSLPLIFTVPIWPKVAPIVSVLLALTSIGFFVLAGWVHTALMIRSEPRIQPRRPVWEYAATKYGRPYIRLSLSMAGIFLLQGVMNIIMQWWFFTKDWESIRFGMGALITSVVSFAFFALMWGRVGSPVDRALDRPFGMIPVVMGLLAVFGIGSWQAYVQMGNFKVGPAAPWTEQWSQAQRAVTERYGSAVLRSISASRDYDAPDTYDANLTLRFIFVSKKDGSEVQVTLRDGNPEASVRVSEPVSTDSALQNITSDEQARLNVLYDTIRISPRDALLRAVTALDKEMPGAAKEPDTFPSQIGLYLNDSYWGRNETFDTLGKPLAWEVKLYIKSDLGRVNYWIDAQTGEALLREREIDK